MKLHYVSTLTEGAHVLEWGDGSRAIWALVTLRKETKCIECWKDVMKKGTKAYRPIGNPSHRSSRLCVPCAEAIVKAARP